MTDPKHKICIVGEAWGAEEARLRMPFVGASGTELTRMLDEADIRRTDCFLTNVFNLQPRPTNDITNLCGDKASGIPGRSAVQPGKYIRSEYSPELERLRLELLDVRPNIAIALGGTATWALLGQAGISKIRGTIGASSLGCKVLPTFHPAAILRDWSLRPVTVLDLAKARRESEYPEIRRPKREIWIEPTLGDLDVFRDRFIVGCSILAFDIETAGREITCIGFAPNEQAALVIPFTDFRKPTGSFWPSLQAELQAWGFVRSILNLPCRKVAQNGLYDTHFLWAQYGITVTNFSEDCMLLHHSLQPESQKGLGFLGSVYTNEPAWKMMRERGKTTIKRDE